MKVYTFQVHCSFEMQWSFEEAEVCRDHDGDEQAVEPTPGAIEALRVEVETLLSETYPVARVELAADSQGLLGVADEAR